jgi:hypothetical protein
VALRRPADDRAGSRRGRVLQPRGGLSDDGTGAAPADGRGGPEAGAAPADGGAGPEGEAAPADGGAGPEGEAAPADGLAAAEAVALAGLSPRAARLRLVGLALAIGALFAAVSLTGGLSSDRVRDWIEPFGVAAPLVFIPVSAGLTVALFPGPLLAGASGLLFGTALGFPVSLASAVLGACLAFLVSRHLGADLRRRHRARRSAARIRLHRAGRQPRRPRLARGHRRRGRARGDGRRRRRGGVARRSVGATGLSA